MSNSPQYRRLIARRVGVGACLLGIAIVLNLSLVAAEDAATTLAAGETGDFAPLVAATCKADVMNIKVTFAGAYSGAVHARDFRNGHCMVFGNGSVHVAMSLNLVAKQGQSEYCGILVSGGGNSERAEERSVQLAVRIHRTLELADDKFYVITCGKNGYGRDDNAPAVLKFLEPGTERRVRETVYNRPYTIRAELTQPNGTAGGIRVTNCFAFNRKNSRLPLIDEHGCPLQRDVIGAFRAGAGLTASAQLGSMFRFPDGSEVQLQCDVAQCADRCADPDCGDGVLKAGVATKGGGAGAAVPATKGEHMQLSTTTVFVLDPAEAPVVSPLCDIDGVHPAWLLWLAIALGVLFLIMLLMNIFLCTAMSCSCARTEIIEKEPSIIEEYDPYRSWHGSQYGSRYSLHGGRDGHNKGYTSGGSTIHSNRSAPIDSDHYAIVHSRPGSRHSSAAHPHHHHHHHHPHHHPHQPHHTQQHPHQAAGGHRNTLGRPSTHSNF